MEEQRDIAIQIEGLKKKYRLGVIGGGTLQGDIQSWWARKRGKEDPNSKIGAKVHTKNEEFYALDGIDLTIYKGERLGIIGHNGAGKSTLLKLLSRVTAPTEGKICIDGRISSMLEVGTGFNRELTGRENIYMNGAILGMSRSEVDSKIEDIIEFSECRQFIDTPVKRYSSGMYVKLAFSVAAHLDNEIMIMDEVLAVGDMAFQKKCLDKMSDVSKTQGRTILYVSHNMNTIRQLCDRVVVLDHGKIIYNGDVEKGIGIYMASATDTKPQIQYKFGEKEHKGFVPREVMIQSLHILNHETANFYQGEDFDFIVDFHAIKSYELVSFRLQIYLDKITLIGSFFLDTFFPIFEGQDYKIRCRMNTKNLIPATYSADVVVFCRNKTGSAKAADFIKQGISFEVFNNGEDGSLYWWRDPFGHVKFDNLELIDYQNNEV